MNRAIIAVANVIFPAGFEVSDDAPDPYEKLKSRLDAGQCMLVWSGVSDKTAFGCPEVNWPFRALHDWCHWQGQLPFTYDGEERAARMLGEQLIALFGDTPQTRRWQMIFPAQAGVNRLCHRALAGVGIAKAIGKAGITGPARPGTISPGERSGRNA